MRTLTQEERVALAQWNRRWEKPRACDRHIYRVSTAGPCTVWVDRKTHRAEAHRRRSA